MNDELFVRVIEFVKAKSRHRYCEDGFYSCPKSDGYFGYQDWKPVEERPCDCGAAAAIQLLKDLEQPN